MRGLEGDSCICFFFFRLFTFYFTRLVITVFFPIVSGPLCLPILEDRSCLFCSRCGRVSVTLTSHSAVGHHRYRSRCVLSLTAALPLPSVKFVSSSHSVQRGAIVVGLQVEVNVQSKKKKQKKQKRTLTQNKKSSTKSDALGRDTRQIGLEAPDMV